MRYVQIGNVAEYDFEFELSSDMSTDDALVFREFCNAYSAVATFFTRDPGLVMLPRDVDDVRWWDAVQEALDWRRLRRQVVDPGDRPFSEAIADDDIALAEIRAADAVVPWGETSALRALASMCPEKFNLSKEFSVVQSADSKAEVDSLFKEVQAHTASAVRVPETHVCHDELETVSVLLEFGRQGRAAVMKTCHGSGGWGTIVVTPELLGSHAACARTLHGVRGAEETFTFWPLVLQELVPASSGVSPDLTADAEIARNGRVSLTGTATMLMTGTRYSGCVVAPDNRPADDPWPVVEEFTLAVGDLLADRGYRGWYDVDFVRSAAGAVYALEVNTRRTGPSVAYAVWQRLRDLRGGPVAVAAAEVIRLPRRVEPTEAFEAFHHAQKAFSDLVVVPTAFMGTDSARPSIGLAVGGSSGQDASRGLSEVADLLVARVASG